MLWSTSQYWITGCTEGVKIMDTWEYLGNNNQPFRDRKHTIIKIWHCTEEPFSRYSEALLRQDINQNDI